MYPNIDMIKTGWQLKRRIEEAGYTVKQIQKYLQLSCPQPIYRWYKGSILPSVDHFYALSVLLGVHMEELIVPKTYTLPYELECAQRSLSVRRITCYYTRIIDVA